VRGLLTGSKREDQEMSKCYKRGRRQAGTVGEWSSSSHSGSLERLNVGKLYAEAALYAGKSTRRN